PNLLSCPSDITRPSRSAASLGLPHSIAGRFYGGSLVMSFAPDQAGQFREIRKEQPSSLMHMINIDVTGSPISPPPLGGGRQALGGRVHVVLRTASGKRGQA